MGMVLCMPLGAAYIWNTHQSIRGTHHTPSTTCISSSMVSYPKCTSSHILQQSPNVTVFSGALIKHNKCTLWPRVVIVVKALMVRVVVDLSAMCNVTIISFFVCIIFWFKRRHGLGWCLSLLYYALTSRGCCHRGSGVKRSCYYICNVHRKNNIIF